MVNRSLSYPGKIRLWCGALACVILSAAPAWAGELRGVVVEFVPRQTELVRTPVPEAHLIVGPDIWLDVCSDGRDRVRDGPPAGYAVTASDGSFAITLADDSAVNVIVWRAGYLPVFRRSVSTTGGRLEFVLNRQTEANPALHKSLDRGDGRLIFGRSVLSAGDHFFDPQRGILATIPEGFAIRSTRDAFTVLRLTRGLAEIRLLDPRTRFDRSSVNQFIGQPAEDADNARLTLSEEIQLHDHWALRRVFEHEGTRTELLYVDGGRSSFILACSGPADAAEDLEMAFHTFVEDLAVVPSEQHDSTVRRICRTDLGLEVAIPSGWELDVARSQDGVIDLHFPRRSGELVITCRPANGLDPEQLLDDLEADGRLERCRARWVLVGGQPAPERIYRTTGGPPRSSIRRVAADWQGNLYLFELRSPVIGFTSASRGMDVALAAARFLDRRE